ncbi:MAG: hypothetical protein JW845_05600 [Dehalococcoidales bacterium]|nr:hypothetical protein [Dehalococcoidales bacterium]
MHFDDIFPSETLVNLSTGDWRRWMFCENVKAEDNRNCVNRLLEFAKNQGILDTEMLARLRNEDNDQFRSAIHELAICEFLSNLGDIDWHPLGRDSHIGEFRIVLKEYEPIFVEVKTIFTSLEERKRDNNWDILREISHGINSPFIICVEFIKLECDIVPRHFRPWLERKISYLKKELKKEGEQKELIFEDNTEDGSNVKVLVGFTRLSENDIPTGCDHISGGFSNLHERVIEVIDGALSQLPDNQPTLVVVASTEWVGLDESSMMAAMFSLPKVTYRLYTEPNTIKQQIDTDSSIHYDLQGVVQKTIRKRLSTVGVWHHKWTKEPAGSLDIYHNPLAKKQIPYTVLEAPNIYQLIPKGKGTMEWVPNHPPK